MRISCVSHCFVTFVSIGAVVRDIVGRASCALDLSVVRGADAIVEVQRSEGLCELSLIHISEPTRPY